MKENPSSISAFKEGQKSAEELGLKIEKALDSRNHRNQVNIDAKGNPKNKTRSILTATRNTLWPKGEWSFSRRIGIRVIILIGVIAIFPSFLNRMDEEDKTKSAQARAEYEESLGNMGFVGYVFNHRNGAYNEVTERLEDIDREPMFKVTRFYPGEREPESFVVSRKALVSMERLSQNSKNENIGSETGVVVR